MEVFGPDKTSGRGGVELGFFGRRFEEGGDY